MPWPIRLEECAPSLVLVDTAKADTRGNLGSGVRMFQNGASVTEVMEKLGVSKTTAYRYRDTYRAQYPEPDSKDDQEADDVVARHSQSQRQSHRRSSRGSHR